MKRATKSDLLPPTEFLPLLTPDRHLPAAKAVELEPFRSILMDLRPGIYEDDLLLELRTEAVRLLPCDRVSIALCGENLVQIFERPDGLQSSLLAAGSSTSIWSAKQFRRISDDLADSLQCQSGLQVPFDLNGSFGGTVSFLANVPRAFDKYHEATAQQIADSIGLILEKAAALNRIHWARPARSDWKDELLRTVCGSDFHSILPRISALIQDTVPHDRITISFHDRERFVSLRSVSNDDGPGFDRFRLSRKDCPPDGTSLIINDLFTHRPLMEPSNFHDQVVDAGYRSFLVTHVWGSNHGLGLVFWSRQSHAFRRDDALSAFRIAELCTVASERGFTPSIGTPPRMLSFDSVATQASHEPHSSEPRHSEEGGKAATKSQSASSWNAVVTSATQVAATDTTVLLIGETGTGKEVLARLIYNQSARRHAAFIAVNCAALPDSLLESELFGFERGAFTGASHDKRGHIELASGGVLFLDEISEMSLAAQAKLLRVLETREFYPLGSTRSRRVDIRVIAATNRNLRDEIKAGKFRADLYYRLCIFEILLPPLRHRKEEILPLAHKFIAEVGSHALRTPRGISRDAEGALLSYDWPGNVRELRNVIERAAILCNGEQIGLEHIEFRHALADSISENDINSVERKMIERVLRECEGNKSRAARVLGLSRTQLYVRLRRYF